MPSSRPHPFLIGFLVAAALVAISVGVFMLFSPADTTAAPPTIGTTVVGATGTTLPSGDTTATTTPGTVTTETTPGDGTSSTSSSTTSSTTLPSAIPLHPWVDARSVGQPWGNEVTGLLTFRGNPTNTYYGTGPIPETPKIVWRYPDAPMCSQSTDLGVTSTWCGNGWTGQPVIWERPDGATEMIFGAYDRRLHFVDAKTGEDLRQPFLTGDIIKGTPTIDPDGYPLVYFGSRDNEIRVLSLDRGEAVELWSFYADLQQEGRWNDDWDSAPRIVNDIMFEGSENSIYYIWKLNRAYDAEGKVTVDPQLLFKMETWTPEIMELIAPSGYPATSVENSTAIFEGVAYFATSAGRVIGLDITNVEQGSAPIVFDYWVGDDVDASIVIDAEGFLYVSAEYERFTQTAKSLGQLVKLDPSRPSDPYVWGMYSLTDGNSKGGLWSTPALGDGVLYAVTHKGFLIAVDSETGEELWVDEVGHGSWSSPAVVDEELIVATNLGMLRFYDIEDPRNPVLRTELRVGDSVIEATPAVWDGYIYVGSRDGFMYAVSE